MSNSARMDKNSGNLLVSHNFVDPDKLLQHNLTTTKNRSLFASPVFYRPELAMTKKVYPNLYSKQMCTDAALHIYLIMRDVLFY